jgi:hypothetical protein
MRVLNFILREIIHPKDVYRDPEGEVTKHHDLLDL